MDIRAFNDGVCPKDLDDLDILSARYLAFMQQTEAYVELLIDVENGHQLTILSD